MPYKIAWMSCSQWAGTQAESHDGDEEYATREEAEAAKAELEKDNSYMDQVTQAAIETQGVEGWLEIKEIH